jgi:Pup-like protein
MKQERIQRGRRSETRSSDVVEDMSVAEPDAALLTDVDALLDEIDSVLEDQSMLANFRQRSGQ